jgi:hypothetical protein
MNANQLRAPAANLEKLLAESGPAIQAQAPEQHARLKRVLQGIKKGDGKKLSPELEKDLREIYKWQLEAQRQEYVDQLERLKPQVKAGDPLAKQADQALRKLVEVFELGMVGAGVPTPATQKALEKAAAQAKEALEALDAAYTKRVSQAVMKPVPGGVIKSPSGVALKPVAGKKPGAALEASKPAPSQPAPPTAAPAALGSFRVMPGTAKLPPKKK